MRRKLENNADMRWKGIMRAKTGRSVMPQAAMIPICTSARFQMENSVRSTTGSSVHLVESESVRKLLTAGILFVRRLHRKDVHVSFGYARPDRSI